MNDNKVEQLMTEYAKGLGHLERTFPHMKRSIFSHWKPVAFATIGLAGITFFVLIPRRAEAASMENVVGALGQIKYWSSETWTKSTTTSKRDQWGHQTTTTYWNGILKFRSGIGGNMELTSIIDNGFEYDDFKNLPYILKYKVSVTDLGYLSRFQDPLKHVLTTARKTPDKLTRQDGLRYKGKAAYSLTLKPKDNATTFEAIVEKSTDLPLLVQVDIGQKNFRFQYKTEYHYSPPSDASAVAINPNKKVVDQEVEKRAIQAKWSRVESAGDRPTLYQASISPDGTIWVTFGVKNHTENGWTPLKIGGGNYAQSSSFLMNSYGNAANFRTNGNEVAVANFVPIDEKVPTPSRVSIEFGYKKAFLDATSGMKTVTIQTQLELEDQNYPSFFPAFMGEVPVTFLTSNYWNVRAHSKMAKGDLLGAAKSFEKSFDVRLAAGQRIVSPYMNPLKAAAECYDKLGMKDKAKAIRQRMQREKEHLKLVRQ